MVILDAPLNRPVVVFVIDLDLTLTCLHTAKTTTTKKLHKFCLQRDEVEMYRIFVVATINVYQRFLP